MTTMNTKRESGFSMLEVLVTIAIVSILLGIGIPSFQNLMDTNRMAAAVNDFVGAMHAARAEAIKRRANVTVCASSDWDTADPDCDAAAHLGTGWIIFVDGVPPVLPNGDIDGPDELLRAHGPLAGTIDDVTVNAGVTVPYVSYGPGGFAQQIGALVPINNIQICDRRGNVDTGGGVAAGRWINVAATGRPQVFSQQADVQGNPLGGC
ncbi:MAG: GspH/FimT family pseudopilin [Gammaproteobacteria bacterium]